MKKIITSLSLSLFVYGTSHAQLNNFAVGDVAPNFTVTDLHGHTHQLSDYAGKVVLLDFFAYWCGPCAQTAPILNDFYIKYGCNGYDIIVLGLEYEGTTAQTQQFETTNADPEFPYPSAAGIDGGAAAVHSTYGAAAFPTIVMIGADGKFKNIDIWPISDVSTFENAVTAGGGGSLLVEHNCAAISSVNEIAIDAASVYPNPTSGNATVKVVMANSGSSTLAIYSVEGELLSETAAELTGGENSVVLPMSELAKGTYLVRVSANGSTSEAIPVVKL